MTAFPTGFRSSLPCIHTVTQKFGEITTAKNTVTYNSTTSRENEVQCFRACVELFPSMRRDFALGSATLISPLELIRTKMQFRPLSYKELTQCIQMSVANEGWLSLWKGWGPTVLRDVPFSAMYWYNYELGKKWLCQRYNKLEPTFTISFTAGAMSGSIAAVVTLPFDVVKTRRQVELGELESLKNSPKRSSSTWKIMYRIISENGFQGLFAGLIPRLIKIAPACAIMISTYEFGKAFFRKLNNERQLKVL
ncbi:hypothetical protein AB205_0039590 [Aquarana catesbeiana]|uniref:Mitochondrial glutathione transporter SLC25A40 n=1 Tax=Aquarana catesbeiana TaxID=8400 RepID=A0A2G9SJR9_AQUCT|nr:hypothetical protein AB205_0039590 [Aquarana catesbeiana]